MAERGGDTLARATIRGTLWTYASHYSGKVMVFASTIILARLLLQEDFGVAGYALIVIGFLDILHDLGVGAALIYEREKPGLADTAFWLGMGIALILFVATWMVAPLAAAFFNDERAVAVTRVLAFTFPLNALSNVHYALLRKELAFHRKFVPDFTKAISKGALSIVLALAGFGAWSLIIGQVGGTAVSTIAYWRMMPWRPTLRFAPGLARTLLSYGVTIVLVNCIAVLVSNMDYLLIGRFLGAAALGIYTLAFRIPELVIMQFCYVVATVIFPVYAKMSEDTRALSHGFLATTRYVSMVTVPMGLGLALVAEPFVLTFLTERWAEAVPVMRAIAIYALILSLDYHAGDVYKAQGRPGILTRFGIVRVIVLFPVLWWAVTRVGTLEAIGWAHVGVALLFLVAQLMVAARMLDTSFFRIVASLRPAATGGALMAIAVLVALEATAGAVPPLQLAAGVAAGAATYGLALWWLQRTLVLELGTTLRLALARR
jgi:O-antigen/teichoic acid export membrane protein